MIKANSLSCCIKGAEQRKVTLRPSTLGHVEGLEQGGLAWGFGSDCGDQTCPPVPLYQ